METWITILIIAAIFIFAISPFSFGKWAKTHWRDLHDADIGEEPSDLEIRAFYRKLAFENIPSLGQNAILKFHDEHLDSLIAYAHFDEANDYRIHQVKLARERGDRDSLNTYTLYKKIIATMEAEVDNEQRRQLRERFGRIREGKSVEPVEEKRQRIAPMRLIEREEDFVDEPLLYEQDGAMEVAGIPPRLFKQTEAPYIHAIDPGITRAPEEETHDINVDAEILPSTGYNDPVPPDFRVDQEESEQYYKDAIRERAEKFARKKGIKMRQDIDKAATADEDEEKLVYKHVEEKKFEFKTEKLKTKKQYKDTDQYSFEKLLATEKRFHYDNDDAFKTPVSSEGETKVDKFEVSDKAWGDSPDEPADVPAANPDKKPEEKYDDDDYSDLIDI